MIRFAFGATAMVLALSGGAATQAGATDLARCLPHHHHRHVVSYGAPRVVYGRAVGRAAPRPYNYEDNGRYDGADTVAYGQPPSWLDGYGTRPAYVRGYGSTDVYGGSSQVSPVGLPPGGGLPVYIPGAFGPGPRIIAVPQGY